MFACFIEYDPIRVGNQLVAIKVNDNGEVECKGIGKAKLHPGKYRFHVTSTTAGIEVESWELVVNLVNIHKKPSITGTIVVIGIFLAGLYYLSRRS